MNEYLEGKGTEIENFPQAGDIYMSKAKDIHNTFPTELAEKLHLARIRAELRNLRRKTW